MSSSQGLISFDRAAHYYDQTRGFPPDAEAGIGAVIARAGELTAHSRVLEIAIGTGRVALPLARHLGAAVHGVDISAGMLAQLLAKRGDVAVYPAQADVYRLPYADGTFDAVLAVHIFHLLPDFERLDREMRRVLVRGGAVLHCWNTNDSPILRARNNVLAEAGGRPATWQKVAEYLPDAGWRETAHLTYDYTTQQSPEDMIKSFQGRVWSSTWTMSDAELERRTNDISAQLRAVYDDLSQPVPIKNQFHATRYVLPD